ncbi:MULTISPECIES: hypothetical protein [Aphanothece]|uniref:hypothetical protein n=1 Tax=Aphanothece TaxID=1121 RepID=UPI003984654C
MARYLWNIDVSRSLHPVLHVAEVTFRNQLHNALTGLHGATWYDTPHLLTGKALAKVAEAKSNLARDRKPLDPGRIVAALSFGFWTSLYDRQYQGQIVNRTLQAVFPHYLGRALTRTAIAPRLRDLRFLRNRISHFEPVAFNPQLPQRHADAMELISWMHPSMATLVRAIDHFPRIYGQSWVAYRPEVTALFDPGFSR